MKLRQKIKQSIFALKKVQVKRLNLKNIKKSLQKSKTKIQFRKILAYFFARASWFIIHSFYTYKRIVMQKQGLTNALKVNSNFYSKNICNTLK